MKTAPQIQFQIRPGSILFDREGKTNPVLLSTDGGRGAKKVCFPATYVVISGHDTCNGWLWWCARFTLLEGQCDNGDCVSKLESELLGLEFVGELPMEHMKRSAGEPRCTTATQKTVVEIIANDRPRPVFQEFMEALIEDVLAGNYIPPDVASGTVKTDASGEQ